jgi:mono/diheme cytochrome c family protein
MRFNNLSFYKMLFLTGCTFFLIGSSPIYQKGDWKAPKEADALKNPVKDSEEATLEGQKLYTNMCVICHGKKGKGDGVAGVNLNPRPTNFTTTNVQQQTDGAIYWKITEGRVPMASYKSILTEEQRWQLVNYIRKLKK